MEAQAALVRADGGVELHAVTAVDLRLALVVHPDHAELDHALRLDEPLEHGVGLILGVPGHHRFEGFEYFPDRLQKLGLVAIALLHLGIHALDIFVGKHRLSLLWVIAKRKYSMRWYGKSHGTVQHPITLGCSAMTWE